MLLCNKSLVIGRQMWKSPAFKKNRNLEANMAILAAVYHLTHYKYDQPGHARTAGHPAAAGAAFAHQGAQPLAEGVARQSFRQRPAGSVRQLPGALRLPGAGDGAEDRGRSGCRHDGLQPVRLLRRTLGGDLSLRIPGRHSRRPRNLPHAGACRTAAEGFPGAGRPFAHQHGQFRRRAERAGAARDRLHHPHGNRRA